MKKEINLIRNTFGITALLFKNTFVITSLLFLGSCRSTDTENNLSQGGVSAVGINLLGTEYSKSELSSSQASGNHNGSVSAGNNVQSHSVLINPSSVMVVSLAPSETSRLSSSASSSGLSSAVAVSGNSLTGGTKFRVIAYRSNGAYHIHQDYTIGRPATPMMLDNGATYTIIVYSYGTNSLPALSAGEQSTAANALNSAQVNYDDANRDFMYQKLSFTPQNYANNTLNITLRHKVAQITTILNSGSLGNITSITGAVLAPHYSNGVYPLSSGVMTGSSRTAVTSGASLSFTGLNTTTATASPVLINADTGGASTGSFSANLTIGGITKAISLPNSFKITPENKSNLTINLVKCGAYIGPNTNPANYKEFMCHNLGADTSADPFAASAAIHGAKYQWGAKTNEAGRYVSQSVDQSNSGTIAGWNTAGKPNGSWSDASKTANDPCPPGYRVPTRAQWQAVIDNNNNVERVGSWANDKTNYTTALYFRNPSNVRTLMLPAAGFRNFAGGSLINRGDYGFYWSSSEATFGATNFLLFYSSSVAVYDYNRASGLSVRCVAE
ncbi:fibrobacter succinogenes major paralogous domain-containing protein [Elizabethkingia meningoseptica]|uniref:FISUMP domain-containing protein n=1 Tax=Elizabethkingia meningoseptica TaxID=238 RepID=UPI0023B1A656|nr:FISUMP domain-containing protein [Elizabethkingia meningoseptica]MDE5509582.1 fibrobacter succinogenes major paralogous domain-containing protein [Elizabethkingia meningoseptica]